MGTLRSIAVGMVFGLVLAAATADAQVKTGGKNESARAITISGSLDFAFVHRSEGINEVLDNEYQRARAAGTTNLGRVEDDNATHLSFYLRFDVELAEKVSAVLEFENPNQDTITETAGDASDNTGAAGGLGSQYNTGLLGNQNDFSVFLGQAYIEVKEFLWQQLSFKLGIQDHAYDLRGNGNAFFMDIRNAELAWARPQAEAFAGNIYYGHEIPASSANSHGGTAGATFNGGLFRDFNREAGGLKLTYNVDDNLFVDFFWFQVFETSAGAAPAVAAGVPGIAEAEDRFDEYAIGFNVDYNIDEKSLFNFIYTGIYGDDGHVNVHTVGMGIDYYLTPEFEAYLEIYGQWGESGHVSVQGLAAVANDDEEIDHEAYAGIVGLKYTFDHELKPWFDLSFTYISGDDGDISTLGGASDSPSTNHDFISYEDNDATLILEDNSHGLDVDSNYWKIQGEMGITTTLDRQDDFTISTLLAWAELAHGPTRAGIAPGANGLELDDDAEELGLEWDVKLTWNYTESLSFYAGFAWLFTDEDDFWHNGDSGDTGSAGGPAIGQKDGFGVTEGEELWLMTTGATVRF